MSLSYGFIETRGLVGSIEAADAMLKAAKVRLIEKREIGFGLVTIIVEGELGAVQAAVDAGSAAAERVGQFITSHVIPRPFSDTQALVKGMLASGSKKPVKKVEAPAPSPSVKKIEKKSNIRSKVKPAVKKKPGKAETTAADSLIKLLQKNRTGLTLAQLSESLKQSAKDVRILLKSHIDSGKVEKVQQRYFLI